MALLNRLLGSTWLLHGVLFVTALLWLQTGASLTASATSALTNLGGQIIGISGVLVALLALIYQRANTGLQAIVLVAAFLWILHSPNPHIAVAVVAILLPVNCVVFALLEERGLFGPPGLIRLAALLAQGLLIAAIEGHQPQLLWTIAGASFLPEVLSDWTALPDQGLLLLTFGVGLLTVIAVHERTPPVTGALSALLIAALSLGTAASAEGGGAQATALAVLAILALLVATLQEAHRLAFRDALTGLSNRRAMDAALLQLGGRYSIAMMDIDHFKNFNDTYGHDIGDQVLRRVARLIGRVGSGGRPFRYGGEEFSVVFPGRNAESTVDALEAVRNAIAATPFTVRDPNERPRNPKKGEEKRGKGSDKQVQITISIGVAEPSARNDTPFKVIQAADQALYQAKRSGRNRLAQSD